jgi:hypothetical protein
MLYYVYRGSLLAFWKNMSPYAVVAAGLSKTAVNSCWTAWRHIPGDSIPHWYFYENLQYDSCIDVLTHQQYSEGSTAFEFNKKHLFAGLEIHAYTNKDPRQTFNMVQVKCSL